MDTVFVEHVEAEAVIGAYDWEREIRQPLVFDLEMGTSITAAAASDRLEDTSIDYHAVVVRLQALVAESRFYLLEALVTHVAETLLAEFTIEHLTLTVRKPRPEGFTAGLRITRP